MFASLRRNRAVTVTDAAALAQSDTALLLDVRTREEWKAGHAPDARHISLASLPERLPHLPTDVEILAICRSGHRSAQAVGLLRQAGLEARNVKGGMRAWERAGLKTTKR